ncbi:hypothetical protein FHW31_001157 [Enterobacter asburiae]|jgi:hypothetical protein|nr:hypothetical protein P346_00614 [Enterobacter sp. DC1]NIH89792.1 hypothetical protein [Enterobacter asburiae]
MIIKLDPLFYTQSAIENIAQQFNEYLSVEFTIKEAFCLRINTNEEYLSDAHLIINTFLTNILDLSIQDIMHNEH